jgi:translation initiation factor 2B subunit (eIF-2B alpha/beta/delta family)
MENNKYFNKSLKNAQEAIKAVKPLMDSIPNIVNVLKKDLQDLDPNVSSKISELEKYAKNGDINKLLELKKQFYANKR